MSDAAVSIPTAGMSTTSPQMGWPSAQSTRAPCLWKDAHVGLKPGFENCPLRARGCQGTCLLLTLGDGCNTATDLGQALVGTQTACDLTGLPKKGQGGPSTWRELQKCLFNWTPMSKATIFRFWVN